MTELVEGLFPLIETLEPKIKVDFTRSFVSNVAFRADLGPFGSGLASN